MNPAHAAHAVAAAPRHWSWCPRGFTLIELLVVITVVGILMSMLMPVVNMCNRLARITATRAVMAKVDSAARIFRHEIGSYPWQKNYDDLAGGTWTNRLYYHLGTDIAPGDLTKLLKDADDAAALYIYDRNNPPTNSYAFTMADCNQGSGGGQVAMCNRMAAERARLAIFAGNANITSPVLQNPWKEFPTYARRVMPTAPLLSPPASAAKPGWAKDYLRGEIEQKYIANETILDAWKRPIIYVGQVVEGMAPAPIFLLMGGFCSKILAVGYGMQPLGRRSLAEFDALTGDPVTVDPLYLPDLNNMRNSDRRYYAAPGNEVDIEWWSAGPNGKADWLRDAAVNTDNVSLTPYDLRIP